MAEKVKSQAANLDSEPLKILVQKKHLNASVRKHLTKEVLQPGRFRKKGKHLGMWGHKSSGPPRWKERLD